jgi:hypothetical protein
MSSEMQWCRFRIGDVFPAGSALAKWIAGLTLIANDILQAHAAMQREFKGGPESPEGLFYFWLTCAQFREAAKVLADGIEDPEIAAFIDTLEADDQQMLQLVKPAFEPFAGSFFATIAKPLRDQFFHYPKPRDREWDSILGQMSDMESGIRVGGNMQVSEVRGNAVHLSTAKVTGGRIVHRSVRLRTGYLLCFRFTPRLQPRLRRGGRIS